MRRLFLYALVLVTCLSGPVRAADDGEPGGLLVNFLEDTLSGDNRRVKVTGLEGALSSRATIERLTVSDEDGVWLTIVGAELDWNRLALVRGRFSVNALTADQIIVARRPKPDKTAEPLPSPEAQPFQLPELPVAIELGEIAVRRFELGAPVLGTAAELQIAGRLTLADGALDTGLSVTRLDRPGDEMELLAQFQNETRQIALDLRVIEDAGGLISTALNMPERPPLLLTAKGAGPVSDFTADIALATQDAQRLGGQVRLRGVPTPGAGTDTAEDAGTSIAFTADLSGDVTPMLPPDYRAFFGTDTRLNLSGRSDPDGRLEIGALALASDALTLDGRLAIAAGGKLDQVLMQGRIAPPSGAAVVLPLTGPRTALSAARFTLRLDASAGNEWDLILSADRLSRPDLTLRRAELTANGTLDQSQGLRLQGDLRAALTGLVFADDALNRAVGQDIEVQGGFATTGDGALALTGFELRGADYTASVDGTLAGLESGFEMDGRVRVGAADLSRFSGLAGRPIGGAATLQLDGKGAPLGGSFDFTLDVRGQDLTSGIDRLDALIAGQTILALDAARGPMELDIRAFALDAAALSASASGSLRSQGSVLRFQAALDDLARLTPAVTGPLTLTGDLRQDGRSWDGAVRLKGPERSFADLSGTFDPDGNADLDFDAVLDRIERFVPELAGTLSARGKARRAGGVWTVDADASGPSGIETRLTGSFDESAGTADMNATGQLRLEGANPFLTPNSVSGTARFDLALNGAPSLQALSGTITTSGARVAIPAVAQSLENIDATVTLADARATLAMTGALRAGGGFRVSGPVALTPPFDGRIAVDLLNLVLTDNISFTSSANGQLLLAGPLTAGPMLSGRIEFGETNINLSAVSGSAAAAPIPPIVHVGEPGAVHATRARAGLIDVGNGSGPAIGLDVTLLARNRVFASGFGLQAELGGALRLRGTTANVVPAGQIELIRGTLDIVGRRLKLTKGVVTMQGDLRPWVEFASTASTEDGQATIEIAGPIDTPKVSVYAEPERPSEEALAMLVFGSRVSELSPFALARMAASLATLGRAGGTQRRIKEATGVDTVDIGTDPSGAGQVGAGAYVSENVYTEFNVNTRGETELNLNLDVTKSLTLKGTMTNTGDTGVGLFYERDY